MPFLLIGIYMYPKGIWKLNGWLFLHLPQISETDFRHQVLCVVLFINIFLQCFYLYLGDIYVFFFVLLFKT